MGKIIALMSGKGGAGTSSLTTSLGLVLSQKNKKVLLVDTNAGFRTVDDILQMSNDILFDISDIVSGNCDVKDAIKVSPRNDKLFLLPAPSNLSDAVSPDIIKDILLKLKNDYDVIIIDIPSKFDDDFKTAFLNVDQVLLVSEANELSAKAVKKIKFKLNEFGVLDTRLIINKFSKKNFLKLTSFEDLDELIDEAETRLIAIIPDDINYFSSDIYDRPRNSNTYEILCRLCDRLFEINQPLFYKYLK